MHSCAKQHVGTCISTCCLLVCVYPFARVCVCVCVCVRWGLLSIRPHVVHVLGCDRVVSTLLMRSSMHSAHRHSITCAEECRQTCIWTHACVHGKYMDAGIWAHVHTHLHMCSHVQRYAPWCNISNSCIRRYLQGIHASIRSVTFWLSSLNANHVWTLCSHNKSECVFCRAHTPSLNSSISLCPCCKQTLYQTLLLNALT